MRLAAIEARSSEARGGYVCDMTQIKERP